MFEFDINNVLDEIKNLSTQEKIKTLDEVCERLEFALNELLCVEEEIESQ